MPATTWNVAIIFPSVHFTFTCNRLRKLFSASLPNAFHEEYKLTDPTQAEFSKTQDLLEFDLLLSSFWAWNYVFPASELRQYIATSLQCEDGEVVVRYRKNSQPSFVRYPKA